MKTEIEVLRELIVWFDTHFHAPKFKTINKAKKLIKKHDMKEQQKMPLYFKTTSFPSIVGKWCFITSVVDILGNPIKDHELNDFSLVGQSWTKCNAWIKKAEKRCIKAGIKNFYEI